MRPSAELPPAGSGAAPGPKWKPRSARERRLWMVTAAVLVSIYASALFAGTLLDGMGARGWLPAAFGLLFLAAIAAVVGIALAHRPRASDLWVLVAAGAAFGMIIVRMGVGPMERTHLFEYGLLAVLIHQSLLERRRNGARVVAPSLLAVLAAAVVGWADEGLQLFLPGRVYDWRDVAVNGMAAAVATAASAALAWLRRRPQGSGRDRR